MDKPRDILADLRCAKRIAQRHPISGIAETTEFSPNDCLQSFPFRFRIKDALLQSTVPILAFNRGISYGNASTYSYKCWYDAWFPFDVFAENRCAQWNSTLERVSSCCTLLRPVREGKSIARQGPRWPLRLSLPGKVNELQFQTSGLLEPRATRMLAQLVQSLILGLVFRSATQFGRV